MPAAFAIPAIIGAAGTVTGAVISSRAAGKAAKQQVEAGNKALSLQEKMYQQTRGDLAPWMGQGQAAISTLGGLMGLGGGGGAPAAAPSNVGRFVTDPRTGEQRPVIGRAVPRAGVVALSDVASASPRYGGTGYGAGSAPVNTGYVAMRAPDGTVGQVPPDFVDHYRSLGAVQL